MVYTVTFNPALDYVVRMDGFRAGDINRTQSEEVQFGGKGINVSTVLRNLGISNVALGFLAGFTGQALERGLRESGIQTDFIWLTEGLTRINVKIKAGEETEINGRGPAIPAAALEELFRKLDRLQSGDILDLSGSIPASLPDDVYQKILAKLEGRGILSVVDATRDLLCAVLPYKPFLIKPNVLVSMAGDGSLLLDEAGNCHRLGVPKGKVLNSVGAGDSMVAGFLAGWLERGDYAWAHRLGTAAGAATAFSQGLAERDRVRELLEAF